MGADNSSWFEDLDRRLESQGLVDVTLDKPPVLRRHAKAWTEDYLLVWEELDELLPSKKEHPSAPLTKEAWNAMLVAAVRETSDGVAVHSQTLTVAVGRKPS